MIEQATFWETYWWLIPVGMMVLCFFMMRGRGFCMMGGHHTDGSGDTANPLENISSNPAMEILNRRYALGEIDREEYEERKKAINQ